MEEGIIVITTKVDRETWKKLKEISQQEDLTISQVVRRAIRFYLENRKKEVLIA